AFQYPSPLHIKIVPNLVRETKASVLLATDTFVNQYARSADAEDLSGLQFIVCGAEKVRDETHDLIVDRFGPIPVLEGYGATEASPVIAVNQPQANRRGTARGRPPPSRRTTAAAPSGACSPASRPASCRWRASAAAGASTCAAPT